MLKVVLTGLIYMIASANIWAADSLKVMHTGFTRNHSNNIWLATLKVTNQSGVPISGPIQVTLTGLSGNPAPVLVNATGSDNGNPYIVVTQESLAPGATATVPIKFTNPSNAFITFTPVVSGGK